MGGGLSWFLEIDMKIIILAAAAMFTFSFSAMAVAQGNGESSEASEAGKAVSFTAVERLELDLAGVVEKAGESGVAVDVALEKNPMGAESAPGDDY
jgi:hypothetical protein